MRVDGVRWTGAIPPPKDSRQALRVSVFSVGFQAMSSTDFLSWRRRSSRYL
jgi:hypothetical protein